MICGVKVHGNTIWGKDTDDPDITFRPLDGFIKLTGTGTRNGWSGATNLTTHTGTMVGVYDLTGNIFEWTATLSRVKGSNRFIEKGLDTGLSMPGSGYIISLSTDSRLRRYGVPGRTDYNQGLPGFGHDGFFPDSLPESASSMASMRGGACNVDSFAGVWCIYLGYARSSSKDFIGFRPVLRY